MSLSIIRNDLLNVKCEAIVNPTDAFLSGSGSIDKRIHDACGELLNKELEQYDNLDISNTIVTKSYELDICDYIIHVLGPTIYQW